MYERKKAHRQVVIVDHRQADVVDTHHFAQIGVGEDDAFRFARRAGSVDNQGNIAIDGFVAADFGAGLGMRIIAETDEFIEVDRCPVFGITYHIAVEDNEFLQRIAHFLLYLESIVILLLFSDEEETYLGFTDNVCDLIG